MQTQLIVGVAGGSGAGKHVVIHDYLLPALQGNALVLEHDWYYHELEHLFARQGVSQRTEINYDMPDAYENSLLAWHLQELQAGHPIQIHPYQKGIGLRRQEPMCFDPVEVVIVDGMMVLAVPELRAQMSLRAYVDANELVRLDRRVRRDMAFSSEEESYTRFYRDVLPAHKAYVEPSRKHAQHVVENSRNAEPPLGMDAFVADMMRLLDSRRQARGLPGAGSRSAQSSPWRQGHSLSTSL